MDVKVSSYSCLKSVLENEPASPEIRIKRKFRTSLTVKNKLEVIEYANQHPSATQSKIASHFGIDRTTVSKVLKRRADILTYADQFNGTNELMYTSLMKKTPPPPLSSGDEGVTNNNKSSAKRSDGASNKNYQLRPLLPKAGNRDLSPEEKVVDLSSKSSKKSGKGSSLNKSRSKESQETVYNPELTSKCESWFMNQNLSPTMEKNNHEYVASIRSFSKLLSMIPLADCECYKILSGKFVRDACLVFVRSVIGGLSDNGRSIGNRSYELLHRFLLEGMVDLDLDQFYCNGFTAFEADDVKRIWVKYVQPKLQPIANDEIEKHRPALLDIPSVVAEVVDDLSLVIPMTENGGIMHSPEYDSYSSSYPASPVAGEDVVRGSRKRKMNSRPIRMVASDNENSSSYNYDEPVNYSADINSNDNLKPVILGTVTLNNNHHASDLSVSKKRKTTDGVEIISSNDKSSYPVIEIKPDGCSDEEDITQKLFFKAAENSSSNKASTNKQVGFSNNQAVLSNNQLLFKYTKSLEQRLAKLEGAAIREKKNNQQQMINNTKNSEISLNELSPTCIDAIVDRCNSSVKELISALSDQLSEVVKSNNNGGDSGDKDKVTSTDKRCECGYLKDKVESLESKIDKIQGTLEKFLSQDQSIRENATDNE